MSASQIVFLVNLLQDVNIVRPLIYLARWELGVPVELFISEKFFERDKSGVWEAELAEIAGSAGCGTFVYDSAWVARRELQHKSGVLIAASESNLSAHVETHDVFRAAPSSYLKVTLQHGYECVGFLQSREHDRAHGRSVRFAADVVCAWCDPSVLNSAVASERSKICTTGPSTLVEIPEDRDYRPDSQHAPCELICENLHSVRLNVGSGTPLSFLDIFREYCARLQTESDRIVLKPHPGGQYVIKNKIDLPANVELETRPIYKIDLTAFDFAISPPSSIVIDMILAGIPVAVWQDQAALVDTGNLSGLTFVSDVDGWLAFRRDARVRRPSLLERQRKFLAGTKMLVDPAEIRRRFLTLLGSGLSLSQSKPARSAPVLV